VADACAGARVDIKEYAAAWPTGQAEVPFDARQDANQQSRRSA